MGRQAQRQLQLLHRLFRLLGVEQVAGLQQQGVGVPAAHPQGLGMGHGGLVEAPGHVQQAAPGGVQAGGVGVLPGGRVQPAQAPCHRLVGGQLAPADGGRQGVGQGHMGRGVGRVAGDQALQQADGTGQGFGRALLRQLPGVQEGIDRGRFGPRRAGQSGAALWFEWAARCGRAAGHRGLAAAQPVAGAIHRIHTQAGRRQRTAQLADAAGQALVGHGGTGPDHGGEVVLADHAGPPLQQQGQRGTGLGLQAQRLAVQQGEAGIIQAQQVGGHAVNGQVLVKLGAAVLPSMVFYPA